MISPKDKFNICTNIVFAEILSKTSFFLFESGGWKKNIGFGNAFFDVNLQLILMKMPGMVLGHEAMEGLCGQWVKRQVLTKRGD